MSFWANLAGYQLVWFCAVIGAGRGLAWPGAAAGRLFAAAQLAASPRRATDLRLAAAALGCGLLLDASLAAHGVVTYAAHAPGWPAPAWILGLWLAFALTLTHSLRALALRPWLAALLGAIGGPLAYLGAARGFDAVALEPAALAWLAPGWALALAGLSLLARRGLLPANGAQAATRSSPPVGDVPR
jgi:hypothetical protein